MSVHDRAAEVIANADGLFIGAGAGMGVDSGLPDFRGNQGFWRAYPPFAKLGLSFIDLANPRWFADDPRLAWGFYGHRLNLYRQTVPHDGFRILLKWAQRLEHGAFVFTSNVDGQFQRAGFDDDRVYECHGSIHHIQCYENCDRSIHDASDVVVEVGEDIRARGELPQCPRCGEVARPNILMFGDWLWNHERSERQAGQMQAWLRRVDRPALIEFGAGKGVPTVRMNLEAVAREHGMPLIRVNPRDSDGPQNTISIPTGALEALRAIDAQFQEPA